MSRLPVFMKDYPAGGGYKEIAFFMQSGETADVWRRFDYGPTENMEKYG